MLNLDGDGRFIKEVNSAAPKRRRNQATMPRSKINTWGQQRVCLSHD